VLTQSRLTLSELMTEYTFNGTRAFLIKNLKLDCSFQ